MITKSNDTTPPLELAIEAMKHIQSNMEKDIVSHKIDRCLRNVAVEYARKRDFKASFALYNEITSKFWLIRALMDIGCEMLEAGEEVAALNTIELAWKNSREQVDGFPEADLLGYLEVISSYGHGKLVESILKFALARVEMMDDGEFRLNCYNTMIPYLAVYCRETVERIVDDILALPNGIQSHRDEFLYPSLDILFDVALAISKYDLNWDQKRQQLFYRSMEFSRQIVHNPCLTPVAHFGS